MNTHTGPPSADEIAVASSKTSLNDTAKEGLIKRLEQGSKNVRWMFEKQQQKAAVSLHHKLMQYNTNSEVITGSSMEPRGVSSASGHVFYSGKPRLWGSWVARIPSAALLYSPTHYTIEHTSSRYPQKLHHEDGVRNMWEYQGDDCGELLPFLVNQLSNWYIRNLNVYSASH